MINQILSTTINIAFTNTVILKYLINSLLIEVTNTSAQTRFRKT